MLTAAGFIQADVSIVDGLVSSLEPAAPTNGGQVLDATGCLVGPGFVDLHTHLRDPGQTWKEDLESGSAAAAVGGYTAVVAMPNTDPSLDDPKLLADVAARGEDIGLIHVAVAAAVTRGRAGGELAPLEDLYEAGARLFTDDGDAVSSPELLAEALRRLSRLQGAVLAQHAEDPRQPALSPSAEVEMLRHDLELVEEVGGRYHCQHVSTAEAVGLLGSAREQGLQVTAEVTPHHLSFDDTTADRERPEFKVYPPIRTARDREALVAALAGGVVDAVATDHALHTVEEKSVSIESAPRGVIGLETAASAVWGTLGDPIRLFEVLSLAPARIAGLGDHGRPLQPDTPAHIVVFDPTTTWVPDRFVSRSANSPYLGRSMAGRVRATVYRGRVTHGQAS